MTKQETIQKLEGFRSTLKCLEQDLEYLYKRREENTMEPLESVHNSMIQDGEEQAKMLRAKIEDLEFHLEQEQLKEWEQEDQEENLDEMTIAELWLKDGFEDAEDLATHLGFGLTAEKLEALSGGDMDAVTLRQAAAIAEELGIYIDDLFYMSTKKREVYAKKVRDIRMERQMTEKEAADVIAVDYTLYRAKESGALDFRISEITALADHWGVEPSELLPEGR